VNIYVCSCILKAPWPNLGLSLRRRKARSEDEARGIVMRELADEGRTLFNPEILIIEIKPTDHYDIT